MTDSILKKMGVAIKTSLDTLKTDLVNRINNITPTSLGLGNVNNTSDLNKPVSTATQTALNTKLNASDNAVSASKLLTQRSIGLAGVVSGSTLFDGTSNVSITTTLSSNGVVAGTYNTSTAINALTIDSTGRVTSVGAPITISPAWSAITNKPTTLSGFGITDGVTKSALDSAVTMAMVNNGSTGSGSSNGTGVSTGYSIVVPQPAQFLMGTNIAANNYVVTDTLELKNDVVFVVTDLVALDNIKTGIIIGDVVWDGNVMVANELYFANKATLVVNGTVNVTNIDKVLRV